MAWLRVRCGRGCRRAWVQGEGWFGERAELVDTTPFRGVPGSVLSLVNQSSVLGGGGSAEDLYRGVRAL
jgi:hypothetical protein